jgi:hypothetical protein
MSAKKELFETIFVSDTSNSFIHRFYDTSPISPSGRYLALTSLPYEDKSPSYIDEAVVTVFDLHTKEKIYVQKTCAWDSQLGAQVQWGGTDEELYFNDLDPNTFDVYGLKVNIKTNHVKKLEGSVYMISPCGGFSISPCLKRIVRVQRGYGVRIPIEFVPKNEGASDEDGLYLTNNRTGSKSLLVNFKFLYEELQNEFREIDITNGAFYGFHSKWSPDGEKILFLIRWLKNGATKSSNFLISIDKDGSDPEIIVNSKRWIGGHHPNWTPNNNVIMNLMYGNPNAKLGFITNFLEKVSRKLGVRYFSNHKLLRVSIIDLKSKLDTPFNNKVFGSGHPSMHHTGNFVVTDCYPNERVANANGSVPIRIISQNTEKTLFELETIPKHNGLAGEWRIDPHPAFSRCGKFLVTNFANGNVRGVRVDNIESFLNAY